jgi:phosphatidylglycerophosphatase A
MADEASPPDKQDPHAVRRLLGAGLGLGYLPIAPGTWGSAAAAIVAGMVFGVRNSEGTTLVYSHPLFVPLEGAFRLTTRTEQILAALVVCVAVYLLGTWAGNHAERDFGRKDPGPFVLDEVVGQGLAILPLLPGPMNVWGLLASFFLFRVFDVIKPSPARELESLPDPKVWSGDGI